MGRIVTRMHFSVVCLVAGMAAVWGAFRNPGTLLEVGGPAIPLALSARRPASPPEVMIRVGLTEEPVRSLTMEVSDAFRVQPQGSSRVLHQSQRRSSTTVTATSRAIRIGKQEFAGSAIEIIPARSPAIWVNGHQYRGRVRLVRQGGDKVLAVNVVPLEEYVASVVDSEMPADFPEAARAAQAIVARTYARYQKEVAGSGSVVDVYASTRSQKYLGYQYQGDGGRLLAGESASSRKIANDTRGRVCQWRGKLFCTYYCAVCGGSTVPGTEVFSDAAPPLASVTCDWCREARLYRWTAEISKADARQDLHPLFRQQGRDSGQLQTVLLSKTNGGGTLPEFDLRGERASVHVSGADLRQALSGRGLYSPRFTVTDKGGTLVIHGRGHGHGVGLCQWGARGQALAGRSCEQILEHYYAGASITAPADK